MSILNNLSYSNFKRDLLVNSKNGFTYAAYITVLVIFAILIIIFEDDLWLYRTLCFIVIGLGVLTSIFYTYYIDEIRLTKEALECDRIYKSSLFGQTKYVKKVKFDDHVSEIRNPSDESLSLPE